MWAGPGADVGGSWADVGGSWADAAEAVGFARTVDRSHTGRPAVRRFRVARRPSGCTVYAALYGVLRGGNMSVTIRMTRAAIFFESVSAIFAPTADGFVSASSTPSITICNTQMTLTRNPTRTGEPERRV